MVRPTVPTSAVRNKVGTRVSNLEGAHLANATLFQVQSGGITGTPASLPTGWQLIDGYLIGPYAKLRSAALTNAIITNANLTGAHLDGATLTNANLEGATLTGADLSHANLTGATLTGADLTGATLTGVTGAAKYNSATILPAGFDPVAAGWTLIS